MSLENLKVPSLQRFPLNFAANIIAALWMLAGSTRAFAWVKPTYLQFLIFSILALASNTLFSWLAADIGSVFNEQGLVSYLIWPIIVVLAGIILARRSGNYSLLFVPAVLWLTADTMSALLQSLIQFLGTRGWLPAWSYALLPTLFLLLFLWQTIALLWIFARKLRTPWWERILVLIGAVALLTVWQKNVADQPIFKLIPSEPTLEESAFYKQPLLLSAALNAVAPNNIGHTDWYFMGVAGFAGQDVFRSEINEARQLFDVRFNTQGHSLSLINNNYSWNEQPVATKTSIKQGLKRIGKQMNTDEDVLFMLLSSHGNNDVIQLENPPLALESIDPQWLRKALDDSGIRWRVIVISACYSGSFIDELASPTTVVITASAADKTSFGCSNEADLTYFGRAFFAESLRNNTSFEAAFLDAKKHLAERESAMGFEPSDPQMVIGSLMKTALPAFEKDLFRQYDDTTTDVITDISSGSSVQINITDDGSATTSDAIPLTQE